MTDAVAMIETLLHRVADLEYRLANTVRIGTVADRDAAKGYRIAWDVDDAGEPVLSPWLPHPDAGGRNADWRPLSPGQIVAAVSPSGEARQAFLVRAGFGGTWAAPSTDLDEVVLLDTGTLRMVAKGGRLTITVDGVEWKLDASGTSQTGGHVLHDQHDIGRTHVHTEVVRGADRSGTPP